jgi:hypothetical protein
LSTDNNNNTATAEEIPKPIPAAQLESQYTYEEPEDGVSTVTEPEVPVPRNLPNITAYTDAVKELAQQKIFHVQFLDGTKKIYQRRKASMKEVIEIERKRAEMKRSKGTPLQVAQALAEFYWYSAQVHLVETKSGKPMTKNDYENTIFEDFRKIIDACEFVMLFGVPS